MRQGFAYLAAAFAFAAIPALADPVPRTPPFAGAVVARKAGEEARFIEIGNWQTVDIRQELLPGDVLRTNAGGSLAILFSDRTQVRLGRNSTLVVKKIGGAGEDTELSLQSGQLWARAERGGEGVVVDTPAAAAAIRGTDWSMSVAGAKTSLIVLEGAVELSNPQGSVTVRQGEAASAAIGAKPTKLAIVAPKDREQMLYYYSLRSVLTYLPASPLRGPEQRAERARIAALPETSRTAEDRVTFAEVTLGLDGREAAEAALASARAARLTRAQRARLDVVEGLIAASEKRDGEAAKLFEGAAPKLDPRRRAVALYGGYFARGLADPARVEKPPAAPNGGPGAAIAATLTAGFLQDLPAALKVIREAEARYPDDASLPTLRAQIALLLDDRPQVEEAVNRALALDPDAAVALQARASYRSGIKGDLEGALADIRRAAELAPGLSTVWNDFGLIQDARGASREAEAAFRKAIALDGEDPAPKANLAIFLLEQDRLAEAKREIDAAIAADPSFDVALVARGRYELQAGENEAALQDLLAGSTANPSYAQALLLLAAGYYESGDRVAAAQALDNADRLDPNDPVAATIRTAIAIDDYDSDTAIASAQDALKRARARGGAYAALSANQNEGSTLNDAYRLQGLDAWGRFYGQAVFDPFSAAALVDQSVAGSPDPFFNDLDFGGRLTEPTFNNNAFSTYFQGLLRDPALLSGRTRSANLLRRPFIEGALGGGFVSTKDGDPGRTLDAEVQGFSAVPFPISFSGTIQGRKDEDSREGTTVIGPFTTDVSLDLGDRDLTGTGYVAAKPTPNDRIVAFADVRRDEDRLGDLLLQYDPPLPGFVPEIPVIGLAAAAYDRKVDDRSLSSGLAVSHTFGERNVLDAGVFSSGFERSSDEKGVFIFDLAGARFAGIGRDEAEFDQKALIGAVSHTFGIGDVTLRTGAEGGRVSQEKNQRSTRALVDFPDDVDVATADTSVVLGAGRAYIDALTDITPGLTVEAGLFGTWLSSSELKLNGLDAGEIAIDRIEPRLGLAWEALPGQWLRVGFLRESGAFSSASLAPVGVVGLQSNQLPLSVTGYADTTALRWDAEWTNSVFTSVDYQHQRFEGLEIPIPGGITTADVSEGSLDRLSMTANLHVSGGFGLFGTLALTDSDAQVDGFGDAGRLPYVPRVSGRAGVTYVNPANLKVTLAENYTGKRPGDLGGQDLEPFWTTDAFLTWEPFDKRFDLELAAYNLFDRKFDVATVTPGWSRTFTGSLTVRF